MKPRVAVAGAGIIGLSTAWRLAQQGWDVTLHERGAAAREASWAAAGMLAPGGEFDQPSELATLAIESRGRFASFVREVEEASGLSIDYQECGALALAYSEQELQALEEKAARQTSMGISSKAVSPAQVKAFWPRVRTETLAGARFYAADAVVNPRELTAALVKVCVAIGVSIREGCEVQRVQARAESVDVHTTDGVTTYEAAVIAAGAWSNAITVDPLPALPLSEPVKGHLIAYQQPLQTCNTILRHEHNYLVQRANGLLLVGSSAQRAGFDRSIDGTITQTLARKAAFVLPHLGETSPAESWIGFRPASDTLHMGPWHSDRLYLAFGHFRNGILLAPITAERITSSLGTPLRAPA